ncbi:MAG: Hsp70 family protein [Synergistaceae bacterium]|jgi:molecular chaperone DnaK|nr:Hsp70 family protein [Synergistaceae bacterium]
MGKIYGIDLGTTNSCISVLQEGRPHIIPVDGNGIVPSVVSLDGTNLLVGRKAWNRAAAFPEQTIRSVKRLMGTMEKLTLGGKEYEPEDISAMILRYLCDEAHKIEGREIENVVITVPAYFSDAQRRATMEAGKRAGLAVERIINEPTAAALFYDHVFASYGEPDLKNSSAKGSRPAPSQRTGEEYALVYDLGGGTFDVSVLRMGEIIEVLASTGDTHLGGDDFDKRIVTRILRQIKEKDGLDLEDHVPAVARLNAVAEKAKISLSEKASVRIEETHIPAPKGNCTVSMELSREEFESMTEDFVDRTVASVEKAMEEAQLSAEKIGKVLLVGGMTRMPVIAARLEKIFGSARMPVVDPDLSVANGAAIQGGIISGENCEQILVDVTPHTLSLESISFDFERLECAPIIPRNTQIPVTRARTFGTVSYHQKAAELKVYQGESHFPEDNTLIGETYLELAPAEAHCPIVVEYSYDLNGIVHMVAEQKGYSRKTEVRIDSRNPQLFSSQGLKEIEGDTENEDEEEIEVEVEEGANAINFVTQHARNMLSKMPAGEKKDVLAETLARYERALLDDGDDGNNVDEIEDELLSLMEEEIEVADEDADDNADEE